MSACAVSATAASGDMVTGSVGGVSNIIGVSAPSLGAADSIAVADRRRMPRASAGSIRVFARRLAGGTASAAHAALVFGLAVFVALPPSFGRPSLGFAAFLRVVRATAGVVRARLRGAAAAVPALASGAAVGAGRAAGVASASTRSDVLLIGRGARMTSDGKRAGCDFRSGAVKKIGLSLRRLLVTKGRFAAPIPSWLPARRRAFFCAISTLRFSIRPPWIVAGAQANAHHMVGNADCIQIGSVLQPAANAEDKGRKARAASAALRRRSEAAKLVS